MALADCNFRYAREFTGKYCAECHTEQGTHKLKKKAIENMAMDTYMNWIEGSKSVPGRIDRYHLDNENKPMPPKQASLHPTDNEIKIIVDWVKRGSPNTVDGL